MRFGSFRKRIDKRIEARIDIICDLAAFRKRIDKNVIIYLTVSGVAAPLAEDSA